MSHSILNVPQPVNEPVRDYAPGSPERASLERRLASMLDERIEIPAIVGGEEIRGSETVDIVCPHDHGHVLARAHMIDGDGVDKAVAASQRAWREWSEWPWEDRAAVFLKAAELLAGPWRDTINAATMLNQSKTVYQAEIDSACELIDFLRFNTHFMRRILEEQPISSPGVWNRVEYRALEGFVFAVSPFNFTSIAGNLPTAPALMGNTVLWKPATTALLSGYYLMRLFEAAGMPPGVINFLPGGGSSVGRPVVERPELAGIHFTGSTNTFQWLWKRVGENVERYRTYPRLVGETGGKDFVFVHPSASLEAVSTAMVRGAFEYQGQKCSAASRGYVPRSLWEELSERLRSDVESLAMGPPTDFRNFMAAVIDRGSYDKLCGAIRRAESSPDCDILVGGGCDDSVGYYVSPTVVVARDPRYETMREELFGPVLTLHVYDDAELDEALELCDTTSPYALTGAVFADDRRAARQVADRLRHAAGNFYINDKPTGAVVGQQPFGGSRASGTNDKAGSIFNLLRWTSQRAIKETFVPPTSHRYPHMADPAGGEE